MRQIFLKKALPGFLCITAPCAPAVLFHSTGDPSYNTNAPSGTLEGSGWEFQGRFGDYLATPVGPHQFVAAGHIGLSVGAPFHYNGEVFTTTGKVDDPGSDLTVWTVSGRFSSYAPLYSGSDEAGKGLVVFGRGVDRGSVVTNTQTTGVGPFKKTSIITNGWEWGSANFTQRWGTNSVSEVTTVNGFPVLKATWDAAEGSNQCMLADKDSSGGVFIKEDGVWKLAGINYAVTPSSTYSFSSDGAAPFKAALFTFSGDNPIYAKTGETNWTRIYSGEKSAFYASRISSRYSWITNHITDFDQDVDGLPDWWEQQHSTSATGLVAGADSDGDTFTNYEEYIADTNPTNAASFFGISGFSSSATQTVFFAGSTGRLYQLFYTLDDLADPDAVWEAAHPERVPGAGENSSIRATHAADRAFYRLKAFLP